MSDVSFSDEESNWIISGLPINSTTKAKAIPHSKLRELFDAANALKKAQDVIHDEFCSQQCHPFCIEATKGLLK